MQRGSGVSSLQKKTSRPLTTSTRPAHVRFNSPSVAPKRADPTSFFSEAVRHRFSVTLVLQQRGSDVSSLQNKDEPSANNGEAMSHRFRTKTSRPLTTSTRPAHVRFNSPSVALKRAGPTSFFSEAMGHRFSVTLVLQQRGSGVSPLLPCAGPASNGETYPPKISQLLISRRR